MKKKKKHYILGALLLATVACNSTNEPSPTTTAETSTPPTESAPASSPAPEAQLASVDLSNLKFDARAKGPEKSAEQKELEEAHTKIQSVANESTALGYWHGDFGTNEITILIESLEGDKIEGHSVCAGNYRRITGTAEMSEADVGVYFCVMNEPGDDKYDGKFEFTLYTDTGGLMGSWAPFKNTVKPKDYELKKKSFEYKTSVGKYPQASERLLTEDDMMDIIDRDGVEELRIMRNEIYARHGYSFKDKEMRQYFEKTDWYMPTCIDVRDDLRDIEVKNIDIIVEYEEYFDYTLDMFGR